MKGARPLPEVPPQMSTGRVIAGISLILGWGALHWVLFYLFAVSGLLVDLLLVFVKAILFNQSAYRTPAATDELFAWSGILQVGLILAGAAGIPAGLAVFWSRRRRLLLRCFGLALLAGILCELYALYVLIDNAFTI